ncbi:MAG: hypothetical protein KUG81_03240 [Gammaproteobacteria bacterium]|nr:hypothetical protein [Gammaproteobacteria bacterium]
MATKLFISPQQIKQTTILGGNIDSDKFTFCIESVQITVIEPLLGTELFDKIVTDFTADNLSGLYLELFNEFVFPITKHESTAQYLNIAQYSVTNGGIFKHAPESAEVVDRQEVNSLADVYHNNAQMYIIRFNKWICKNTITEYKTYQDEVNADKRMTTRSGWYFGKDYKNLGTSSSDNCINECDL